MDSVFHKRSTRGVSLCGSLRGVEEVQDASEQHVDLGLGLAVGARELPATIRRDDRHAAQAEGLVPAAQVDLAEGHSRRISARNAAVVILASLFFFSG